MRTENLFVDSTLARRLEMAEAEGGASCGFALAREKLESGACVETIAGGRAVFTGVGSPITQATGIGLDGAVTAEEFSRLENFFFRRGADVNVETSPYADASLFLHYAKNNYCATEFTSVLVRRVGGPLQSINSGNGSKGVEIERAEETQLDLWVRTVCTGFAEHHAVTPELLEVMRLFGGASGATLYLARVDGNVAGGGALFVRDGIAGLFGASTLVEFRRRGVQRELIRVRMEAAQKAGCEIALTFARPGSISERNILRNGFAVAYTRMKFTREVPAK
ncbi:MAG TPA: GNAT family N-acetyltransferase [Candidatus Acidoferrales bacterium]